MILNDSILFLLEYKAAIKMMINDPINFCQVNK